MAAPPKPLILGLAAAIAIVCCTISALSLAAALIVLPHAATLENIRLREAVPKQAAAAAAAASLKAGRLIERGRYFSDAALGAGRLTPDEQRRALDGLAASAVVDQALTASPASPQNWARRAHWQIAAGKLDDAGASLETSLSLGRYVPGLTVPRLAIILRLLKRQPDDRLNASFDAQARIAAVLEPAQLARFGDDPGADGRIQRALMREFKLFDRYLRERAGLKTLREQARREASR